jgi:glycosyltransferase involved in cell wall biosynthesis
MRPRQLGHLIRCFERQTYENRRMVILDDAGTYSTTHESAVIKGDRWTLISLNMRYPSLGEKRNCTAEMAQQVYPDASAYAIWDDDDLYLPWALEASVAALRHAEWSRPSLVLHPVASDGAWTFNQHLTGGLYHGGWAYRREMFERMGGYRAGYSGPEDKDLMERMVDAGVSQADPIKLGFRPSYIYPWSDATGSPHISGFLSGNDTGQVAWKVMGRQVADHAAIVPSDPPWFDLGNPVISEAILKRPF